MSYVIICNVIHTHVYVHDLFIGIMVRSLNVSDAGYFVAYFGLRALRPAGLMPGVSCSRVMLLGGKQGHRC